MQLGPSQTWRHRAEERERSGSGVGVWERLDPAEAQQGRRRRQQQQQGDEALLAAAGEELEVSAASVVGAGTDMKGQ